MELISKEEAKNTIKNKSFSTVDERILINAIDSIPTIEERKEGHWGYTDDMCETLVCSVCGFDTEDYERYNYCPNCGAKMKGK